jgi:hypothetical protein
MRFTLIVLICICCIGCRKSPTEAAAQAKSYISGWEKLGKSLPDESQVSFFRSYVNESKSSLGEALENPSYLIRMWAAYVIGQIGPDARSLGSTLTDRLQVEPNRGVRIYLLEALRGIHDEAPSTIELLKKQFPALSETNDPQDRSKSTSEYLEADEKVCIAATIYALDTGPEYIKYADCLQTWLRRHDSSDAMHRDLEKVSRTAR